jgi:hypothetical protein
VSGFYFVVRGVGMDKMQYAGLRVFLEEKTHREEAANRFDGYRYLRVTVQEVDDQNAAPQVFYTHCKPEEFKEVLSKISQATQWPDELLDSLTVTFYRSANDYNAASEQGFAEGVVKTRKGTYRGVLRNQYLGGRPRGMSKSTQKNTIKFGKTGS